MKTIEIRHRHTNGILFSGEYENLRDAVVAAVAARANLAGANLAGANLADANLAGAYLTGAKWRDGIVLIRRPLQLHGLAWPVTILDQHMQIGCELHTLAEWASFDNERIARMGGRAARKFWDTHGPALLALATSDGRGLVVGTAEIVAGDAA